MIIGLLAAVSGAALTAFIADGGRLSNIEQEQEINSIRSEIDSRTKKINNYIEKTKNDNKSAFSKLQRIRKSVYDTTFADFTAEASKIVNVDFNQEIQKIKNIKKKDLTVSDHYFSTPSSAITGGAGVFLSVMSPGISLCSQLSYSFKLDKIKASAEMELAELDADIEVVKKECAKIRSITRLALTADTTIKTMKKLADLSVNNMKTIIAESGDDFKKFNQKEQEEIWVTFNYIDALNQLVNMQIVNENGNVNGKFKKFIGEVNREYIGDKNG